MTKQLLLLFALLTLIGCQPQTPEERLEAAGEALEESEDSLESVEQRIEEHEDALAKLRKQRRKLINRVLTLEERVAKRATDVALFRSVQSGLLEAEELSQSAISVDAEDGVVRLSGLVSSQAEEAAAVRIAQSVPGVASVQSRIDVEPPETANE